MDEPQSISSMATASASFVLIVAGIVALIFIVIPKIPENLTNVPSQATKTDKKECSQQSINYGYNVYVFGGLHYSPVVNK